MIKDLTSSGPTCDDYAHTAPFDRVKLLADVETSHNVQIIYGSDLDDPVEDAVAQQCGVTATSLGTGDAPRNGDKPLEDAVDWDSLPTN